MGAADFLRLMKQERWSEALPLIEDLVARAPHIATSWFNHGICLAALDRHGEAAAKFLRAYELDPEDHGAQFRVFAHLCMASDLEGFLAFARREVARDSEIIELLLEEDSFAAFHPDVERLRTELAGAHS